MILDTRLLDVITEAFYFVFEVLIYVSLELMGYLPNLWILGICVPISITVLFCGIKIIRKFIWGI